MQFSLSRQTGQCSLSWETLPAWWRQPWRPRRWRWKCFSSTMSFIFVVSPTSLVIIFSLHKGCLRKDWHAEAHRGTSKVSWEDSKIDWNSNEHRMGALDVCPFIPISGVTEEECVQVSKNFGARLGKEVSHLSFPTSWSFPALCASVPLWCSLHSRLQVFARMFVGKWVWED